MRLRQSRYQTDCVHGGVGGARAEDGHQDTEGEEREGEQMRPMEAVQKLSCKEELHHADDELGGDPSNVAPLCDGEAKGLRLGDGQTLEITVCRWGERGSHRYHVVGVLGEQE